jgi:hypothetical protein
MVEKDGGLLLAKKVLTVALDAIKDYIWCSTVLCQTISFNRRGKLHIVTGADFTHAIALRNLLSSIKKFEPDIKVTVWDLGLNRDQRSSLSLEFSSFTFRDFNFALHPEHVDIRKDAGQYAWKPIAISLSKDIKFPLTLWLDAGDLVIAPLKLVRRILLKKRFFSPFSSGTIADWTHEKTLSFLGASELIGGGPNCNGAVVGFDLRDFHASRLLTKWTDCAMNIDCIAPEGSSRLNHRQDQAVLSVLAAMQSLNSSGAARQMRRPLGILIHQDPAPQ